MENVAHNVGAIQRHPFALATTESGSIRWAASGLKDVNNANAK